MGSSSVDAAHEVLDGQESRPVLVCRGEFDVANAGEIRERANELLPLVPPSGLVIDLSQVTFADSRAIAALLSVRKMLDGRPVHLRGPSIQLRSSLKMLSIDSLFTMDGEDDAAHSAV